FEIQVEPDTIDAGGCGDGELHDPPSAHGKLDSLDEIVAVLQVLGHAWTGRQPVAVLGHPAIDTDRRAIDRRSTRRLDVKHPGVDLPEWNRVAFWMNGDPVLTPGGAPRRAVVASRFRNNVVFPRFLERALRRDWPRYTRTKTRDENVV